MKSGILNFLEPSGPPQACNETALPFTVHPAIRRYIFGLLLASLNKPKVHRLMEATVF